MKKKESQKAQILRHLKIGRKITTWTARDYFGCTRISAVIWTLKHKDGYMNRIKDEMHRSKNGRWCKRYWMEK